MSLVHLASLEVLDQVSLGKELVEAEPKDLEKHIAAHLRLVGAKLRVAGFVQRLHEARSRVNPAGGKASE